MVLKHRHDSLPIFGLGAERAAPFWRGVIRQLIALGALDIDTAGHGGLFLKTDRARPILRGEERVMLRQDSSARVPRRARGADTTAPRDVPPALFEVLRAWRAEQAKTQRIPPYVIFHDSVLRDIAAGHPSSLDDLGQIKGVGASKLARYGKAVLTILATQPR